MEAEMNHCILIGNMGICSSPDASCDHFKAGYVDCAYHIDNRCCHAVAMMTSTRKDRRSRDSLAGLLNGI
jgi:hypothetical protein